MQNHIITTPDHGLFHSGLFRAFIGLILLTTLVLTVLALDVQAPDGPIIQNADTDPTNWRGNSAHLPAR